MLVNTHLSIIAIKVNKLNAPIKRQRVADWIIKQEATICYPQKTNFRVKDTHRLKVRGWKKYISCKRKGQESKGSDTRIRQKRL